MFCSFGFCLLLYAGTSTCGYLMFGDSIESQFTLNMPKQLLATKIAIWTTVSLVLFCYEYYIQRQSTKHIINVLHETSLSNNITKFCAMFVSYQVVNPMTKFALTMMPVSLCLEELLPPQQKSYFVAVIIRTILTLSTLIVALKVPFFGINSLTFLIL